ERRRRLLSYMDLGVLRKVLFCNCDVTGINDHREVGAAAHLVSSINRIVKPLIEVGAECSGQMSARRESQHADSMWIDVPLGSMCANHAKSTLGILKRCT